MTLDRSALRLMIIEALEEIACGTDEGSGCMSEDELEEFSASGGAGGVSSVAGYTLPLGMKPHGPRRDVISTARRSFGGLNKKRKKRKSS